MKALTAAIAFLILSTASADHLVEGRGIWATVPVSSNFPKSLQEQLTAENLAAHARAHADARREAQGGCAGTLDIYDVSTRNLGPTEYGAPRTQVTVRAFCIGD
jgi:hypothetical protein